MTTFASLLDQLPHLPASMWAVLALLVIVPLCIRIAAMRQLLAIVFRPGGVTVADPQCIPAHQRPILEMADSQLQVLGFKYCGTIHDEGQMGTAHARYWLVYEHPLPPTLARISVAHEARRLTECDLNLSTWRTTDGKYIDTYPRAMPKAIPLPEDVIAEGKAFDSFAEQWRYHQKRLQPMQGNLALPDAQAWLARADSIGKNDARRLADAGHLRSGQEPNTFRMRLATAWKAGKDAMKTDGKYLLIEKSKKTGPYSLFPVEILAELDVDHWRREQAKKANATGMSIWSKLLMLGASIVLSGWALKGEQMDVLRILAILGVLMIHELGHFLAMWVFGYRNLNILFIPFFGAVATGAKKPDVVPWKEIVMVLAGPVPGLLAGLVAMFFDYWGIGWLRGPATIAVVLNAMNLLPVLPMDGGHLLRLAIQARWPRLQALFQTLSALGMILIGTVTGTVLRYIGISQLVHAGLPWFIARVVRREHRAFAPANGSREPHSEEEAHRVALRSIWGHPKYRKKSHTERHVIATQIADQLRARPAGLFAAGMALLACTSLLWSPIAAWFGVGMYADRKIAQVRQENAAAGVPSTPEEAEKLTLSAKNPRLANRWIEVMALCNTLDTDSKVWKALDTINAEETARSQRKYRQMLAKDSRSIDRAEVAIEEITGLDATLPAFPEEIPAELAGFLAEVRKVLMTEPAGAVAPGKAMGDDFNIQPLALLLKDARRHLKVGHIAECKADLLACAHGIESVTLAESAGGDQSTLPLQQLLSLLEEAWPQITKTADLAFRDELLKCLPPPDDLMRNAALALFTAPQRPPVNVYVADGEIREDPLEMAGTWFANTPFTKMAKVTALKQRRMLWEALKSNAAINWNSLAGTTGESTTILLSFASPEVGGIAALGYAWERQQYALRPQWQLFQTAAKLLTDDAAGKAQMLAGCVREKQADGSEALVIKPMKSNAPKNATAVFAESRPVRWRLGK